MSKLNIINNKQPFYFNFFFIVRSHFKSLLILSFYFLKILFKLHDHFLAKNLFFLKNFLKILRAFFRRIIIIIK